MYKVKRDGAGKKQLATLLSDIEELKAELAAARERLRRETAARERAEEEFRGSEGRYGNVIGSVPSGIVTLDAGGFIASCNTAFADMVGVPKRDLMGKHFSELHALHARNMSGYVEVFNSAVWGEVREPVGYSYVGADGTARRGEARISLMQDGRKTIAFRGLVLEVAAQERAEEELRRRAENLSALNEMAISLAGAKSVEDVYGTACDLLREITAAKAVAATTYETEAKVLELRYVSAARGVFTKAKMLAAGLAGAFRASVDDYVLQNMLSVPRVKTFEGFHELTNGGMPRDVAAALKEALGIGCIYAVALRQGGEILGRVAVLGSKERAPCSFEILENFANIVAAALLRTRAQGALLKARDELEERVKERTAELTEALKKQAESEEKYRKLVETAPDGVSTTDLEGRITYASPQAGALHGYDGGSDLVGRYAFEFLVPEDRPRAAAEFQRAVREEVVKNLEFTFLRKDGSRFAGDLSASLVRDADGKPMAFVATTRDITGRKRAEEALRRARDELEERVRERTAELERSNEELRAFTYIVSHDMRAPLVNLRGFAGELRASLDVVRDAAEAALPCLEEDQREALTTTLRKDVPEALGFIDASVERMDKFVNGVLKLSRLGRRDLELEPLNMGSLVRETMDTLRHQLEQGRAKFTVGPLPEVVGDRTSMEQIVGNLLTNAVLYLDPVRPGEIDVSGEVDDGEAVFRVRDNGTGIAARDLKKIFEPFVRVGEPSVPGEGMGLAYVQTLVRRHGGRIWCESEPGVGTTFGFTVPVTPKKGEDRV